MCFKVQHTEERGEDAEDGDRNQLQSLTGCTVKTCPRNELEMIFFSPLRVTVKPFSLNMMWDGTQSCTFYDTDSNSYILVT